MKHMWKKNQIIITALAALVAVAGYLNYSGTKLGENALPASTTETEATLTDIDSLDAFEYTIERDMKMLIQEAEDV